MDVAISSESPEVLMSISRTACTAAALAALATPLLAAPAVAGPENRATVIAVPLSGAQEVPPVVGGEGRVHLVLQPRSGRVCYHVDYRDAVGEVTRFHIHEAPVGANGGIVVGLFDQVVDPDDDVRPGGCVSADEDLIREIIDAPGDYYANVHTDVFPAGAMRGQLG